MINKQDLINYFSEGIKKDNTLRIGTEHEKFIFKQNDLSLIPYDGEVSIQAIFQDFVKEGWKEVKEGNNTIALTKNNASITLEPGGQFELSGAPLKSVHETCSEINSHLDLTKKLEKKYNIGFLGIGFLPIGTLEEIPMVPKKRYAEIMTPYMRSLGGLGLEMMYQSATVQANFDFTSEEDMGKKINVSSVLQPLVTGLFANSPFKNNQPSGFESYRGHVWTRTDADRTGIPKFLTEPNMSFEKYVDFALDIPVYALIRDGNYIRCTDYSFADLIEGKHNEFSKDQITIKDWADHISTIFTEVRLKTFIEMRGADAGGYNTLCALPAFWTGILYDETALEEALSITRQLHYTDLMNFRADVLKNGLNSTINNIEGWDLAEQIVKISSEGLNRRGKLNLYGDSEAVHLDFLKDIIKNKESNSMRMIKNYYAQDTLNQKELFQKESF